LSRDVRRAPGQGRRVPAGAGGTPVRRRGRLPGQLRELDGAGRAARVHRRRLRPRLIPRQLGGSRERSATLGGVDEVEVVVAHQERATLRVGEVFLKIDADQAGTDVEVEAVRLAPVPTPELLWRRPPVLALAALPGVPLGRLGEPSPASPSAWSAAGAVVRRLHDAPLPPWRGRSI